MRLASSLAAASLTLVVVVVVVGGACGSPPPQQPPHPPPPPAAPATQPPGLPALVGPVTLEQVTEHQPVHAWSPLAVYTDNEGHRIGGRFVHQPSGFTLDYLRIESAPQGFIWVTSFPTSDKGEPHTQEHLLLGKGNRGRAFGSFESMALGESSAFTDQWHTAYHFNTIAGHDAFWPVFDNQLRALLYPDYTDEEIRREVRNFGVDKDATGTLHLEEKGTVYNEMVRAYEDSGTGLWRTGLRMVYGEHHPLAYDSGGYPEAIRAMTPEDIRHFHDGAYRLSNMGMVGAFPSAMALGDVLDGTAKVLDTEAARAPVATAPPPPVATEAQLPRPQPAPAGEIRVVDFPYSDTTHPGPLMLAWPATRALDPVEHTLLELFLDQLAGDESTPIYKKLVDSKTRVLDIGASAVGASVSWDQGQPVRVTVDGVTADKLDDKTVDAVRKLVTGELARVAALPDGDPELAAIAQRIESRVVDTRRQLVKFLDTPPGFGDRGIGPTWLEQLDHLAKTAGFVKSLTWAEALTQVDAIVHARGNPWRARLAGWGLLDAPYGIAARPSPELRARIDTERGQRNTAELARLQAQYKTADAAATLAAYARDYDAQSATIETAAKATALPPLVDHPPMTLDDDLAYTTLPIAGVPALRATFPTMASTQIRLAFRLDAVPEADLVYLALLPTLLSDAGVLDGKTPIAADAVRERQRREILALTVRYDNDVRTGRSELLVSGAGINPTETGAALWWMQRVLLAPDWRVENVPRLRDLVEQAITANHERMLGAEENWVKDPRDAWVRQTWPLRLHTASFLTIAHDLHRLRWMLEDPHDAKVTTEVAAALEKLAGAASQPRVKLVELAAKLGDTGSAPARAILGDAGKDLSALLPDLPAGTLAADWRYLCRQMAHDLRAGTPVALAGLARTRANVITAATARVVAVGSSEHLASASAQVGVLLGLLERTAPKRVTYSHAPAITTRLREHDAGASGAGPLFVGLVDPATSSGVFLDVTDAPGYAATSDAAAVDYLASAMYSGHGAHSMFMKTWAAGLAYSNGLHPELRDGQLEYYAERCPLLPQTLKFVIAQLRSEQPDANIARYAVAKTFTSRVADTYERRATAMAADLADGLSPDVVRAFRTKIVGLANRPDLAAALYARMPAVYGKVLPGFGAPDAASTYYVIGPEKQLAAYQDYLHAAVTPTTSLHRLYPRDYWVPAKL